MLLLVEIETRCERARHRRACAKCPSHADVDPGEVGSRGRRKSYHGLRHRDRQDTYGVRILAPLRSWLKLFAWRRKNSSIRGSPSSSKVRRTCRWGGPETVRRASSRVGSRALRSKASTPYLASLTQSRSAFRGSMGSSPRLASRGGS